MTLPAEVIGAGHLWDGTSDPLPEAEHPAPFERGTFMGEHLAVERLLRVAHGRMIYLVNNLSRKWSRKKCWACGNKFSPNQAQSCTFCGTPLLDLRFLMTARWDPRLFQPFEELVRSRIEHFRMVSPVALLYRGRQMMAVYHYNGEGLLLDEPSPLRARVILGMAYQLADGLAFLHNNGVVLRPFDAANVLVMPDGTVRWFDLDVERLAGGANGMYRDPTHPPGRDIRNLGAMLMQFCGPEDEELAGFFKRVAHGTFPGPQPFVDAVRQLMLRYDFDERETRASAYTDIGLVRGANEDRWGWRRLPDDVVVYVVADGMGGHARGEVASKLVVETVLDVVAQGAPDVGADPKALQKLALDAIGRANHTVRSQGKSQNVAMGSTVLVTVVIGGKKALILHVGDTRAYLQRSGKLELLTEDHTVAANMVAAGKLSRDEARRHPKANVLTAFVGGEDQLEPEVRLLDLKTGDRLLLCTDGLWRELPESEMAQLLASSMNRRKAIRELVRAAYREGGRDNVAVEVIDI